MPSHRGVARGNGMVTALAATGRNRSERSPPRADTRPPAHQTQNVEVVHLNKTRITVKHSCAWLLSAGGLYCHGMNGAQAPILSYRDGEVDRVKSGRGFALWGPESGDCMFVLSTRPKCIDKSHLWCVGTRLRGWVLSPIQGIKRGVAPSGLGHRSQFAS
jgi:hypothetical protein